MVEPGFSVLAGRKVAGALPEPKKVEKPDERLARMESMLAELGARVTAAEASVATAQAKHAEALEQLRQESIARAEAEGRVSAELAGRVAAEGRASDLARMLEEERQLRVTLEAREKVVQLPQPSPTTVVVEKLMQPAGWRVSVNRDELGKAATLDITPIVKE